MISTLGKSDLPGELLDTGSTPAKDTPNRRWPLPEARSLLDRARRWSVPLREAARGSTPALTLELPDRTIRVRGPKVLEFVLSSRIQFPVKRLMEAMRHSPRRLELASASIRASERRLSEMLTCSLQRPELLGEQLRELELILFSKDHSWRDIMESLLRLGPEFDEYKRVAVIKYLQYLRSRQRALKGIFLEVTQDMATAGIHATPLHGGRDVREADPEATQDPTRSTSHTSTSAMTSLPKGETVCLRLNGAKTITLNLAGNPFTLEPGRRYALIDDAGSRLPLQPGKNLVGRHVSCNVQVDPACRSVSRQHLLVEPLTEDMVLITDVSAHGTQVPSEFV